MVRRCRYPLFVNRYPVNDIEVAIFKSSRIRNMLFNQSKFYSDNKMLREIWQLLNLLYLILQTDNR